MAKPFQRKSGSDKTDFDVLPFGWSCVACHTGYALSEFFDRHALYAKFATPLTIDELSKALALNHETAERVKKLFVGDTFAVISEVKGKCNNPGCGSELQLTVWLEITIDDKGDENTYQLSITDYCILDGNLLAVACNPGFYRGVDIAEGLHKLYLRWWYLSGEITVVCPFIGKNELEYFDRIGLAILRTLNWRKGNPFKRIITRQASYDFKKRITILDKVNDFLNDLGDNDLGKTISEGEGLQFVFAASLLGVQCGSLPKTPDNPHFQCADYFHAKLYGALLPYHSEMVITSYNYIDKEVLQLESLAFVKSSRNNFIHHMRIFEKDQYMTIIPQVLFRER